MTIKQVVKLAQTGELNNIAVKTNIDAIVGYLNLGVLELYKRFPVTTKEMIIDLVDGTSEYDLPADCMWVVAAYGEVEIDSPDYVSVLPINEEDNPLSVNTVGWNKVQVPLTTTGAHISLIYVAAPELVEWDETTDIYTPVDIPVPPQMLEALLHYIGYRAHASMDGNIQAENSTHYTRFEQACTRIEQRGMFTNDDLAMTQRVRDKGFV